MKNIIVYLCICVMLCNACNADLESHIEIEKELTDPHAPNNTNDTSLSQTLKESDTHPLAGYYRTEIPCHDCEKIIHTVVLYTDGKFMVEKMEKGKRNLPLRIKGNWQQDGQHIKLLNKGTAVYSYTLKDDKLYLSIPGVEGKMTEYLLNQLPSIDNNHVWQNRKAKGVDYFAIGNEPFWSIEINNDKDIVFNMADWQQPEVMKSPKPVIFADSTVYTVTQSMDQLEIILNQRFCSDGMSDNIYDQAITLQYKGYQLKGCGTMFR